MSVTIGAQIAGANVLNGTLTVNETQGPRYTMDDFATALVANSDGKCEILYTAKDQPCHMFKLTHDDMADVNAALGIARHPAFTVGGVNKDTLYLGMYPGFSSNGEMLSLPGKDPINKINHDNAVALARANGTGWHVMSNVEYAALALWCYYNGFQPRGNSQHGRSSDLTSEIGVRSDGLAVTGSTQGTQGRTLTGSGPTSWRHNNTPFGIADLNGNVWEWLPGMRINEGEINIIIDNDAALNATDFSVGSAAWKAIDGATGALVAPGTAGTVKYATSGTADYTLVRAAGGSFEGMTNPGANPVSAAALSVLTRYGLYPVASSGLGGDGIWMTISGERLPLRGGSWANTAGSGVFALNLGFGRTFTDTSIGARPAFVA